MIITIKNSNNDDNNCNNYITDNIITDKNDDKNKK